MKIRKLKVLLIFLSIVGIAVFAAGAMGMSDLYVSGTWRYKMTIVVEMPEGIRTGNAVREVSNSRSKVRLDMPEATNPASVKGEAVVVDLGQRGVLFALLKGYRIGENYAADVLYDVFPSGNGGNTAEAINFYKNLKDKKAVLDLAEYPMLITFIDKNNPKTVTPVLKLKRLERSIHKAEYELVEDRFEELFGEGVKLKEIIIEMTDEPVTWQIADVLAWLPDYSGHKGYLGGEAKPPFNDPTKTFVRASHLRKGKVQE